MHMRIDPRLSKVAYVAAGLVAGGVLVSTLTAQAASPTPTPTSTSSSGSSAEDPHPGDNGADGIPESQEHHGAGRGGFGLSLSGTVAAVGTSTVTIKTSAGTNVYSVTGASDIDKNGEASLSALKVGDAVRFSVEGSNGKQIDKLHAGNEALNMLQGGRHQGDGDGPSNGTGTALSTN